MNEGGPQSMKRDAEWAMTSAGKAKAGAKKRR